MSCCFVLSILLIVVDFLYVGITNRDLAGQLERGYRMPQGRDCPDRLYANMRKCWEWKAEDRPTFESLLEEFTSYLIDMEKGKYE